MQDAAYINLRAGTAPVDPDDNDFIQVGSDFLLLSSQAYCGQKVVKALMTVYQENPVYPNYGLPPIGATFTAETTQDLADGIKQIAAYLVAVEQSTVPSEVLQSIASLSVTRQTEELDYSPVFTTADGNTLLFPWPLPAGA